MDIRVVNVEEVSVTCNSRNLVATKNNDILLYIDNDAHMVYSYCIINKKNQTCDSKTVKVVKLIDEQYLWTIDMNGDNLMRDLCSSTCLFSILNEHNGYRGLSYLSQCMVEYGNIPKLVTINDKQYFMFLWNDSVIIYDTTGNRIRNYISFCDGCTYEKHDVTIGEILDSNVTIDEISNSKYIVAVKTNTTYEEPSNYWRYFGTQKIIKQTKTIKVIDFIEDKIVHEDECDQFIGWTGDDIIYRNKKTIKIRKIVTDSVANN
jgi:hypothetical protein